MPRRTYLPPPSDGNRLQPLEWIGSLLWAGFWGALAYKALAERSITLGGRYGISHSEGLAAELLGLLLLAVSLWGIAWLLRLSRFRRPLRFLLVLGWLGVSVAYLVLVP